MDMHSIELPLSEQEAAGRAADQVLAGKDAVIVTGGDADVVLDQAANALAARRCRVLRASTDLPGGLSLSGLMAQITGQPDFEAHDDEVLERGFQALTVLDPESDAVVLLVGGAGALQRSALRYIQFACRNAPALRLVLAGKEGLPDLPEAEMSFLRTRLAASPVIFAGGGAGGGHAAALPAFVGTPGDLPADVPQIVPQPPSAPRTVLPDAVRFRPIPSGHMPAGHGMAGHGMAGQAMTGSVHAADAGLAAVPGRPALSRPPTPSTQDPRGMSGRRSRRRWLGIGLGMAASVAAGVAIGRQSWTALPTPPPEPAASDAAAAPAPGEGVTTAAVPGSAVDPRDHGRQADAAPALPPAPSLPEGTAREGRVQGSVAPVTQAPVAAAMSGGAAPPRHQAVAPVRQADPRPKASSAPARPAPVQRQTAQVADPRGRSRAEDRTDRARASQNAPEWQPRVSSPPWEAARERRAVLGTYVTNPDGVRTFQSIPQ